MVVTHCGEVIWLLNIIPGDRQLSSHCPASSSPTHLRATDAASASAGLGAVVEALWAGACALFGAPARVESATAAMTET